MSTPQKIKALNTFSVKLSTEVSELRQEIKLKQKLLSLKQSELNNVKQKLNNLSKDKKVKITEHALLRFIQRAMGFDLELIQSKIVNDDFVKLVQGFNGNGEFPINEGLTCVVKDYKIITIK